VDLNRAELVRLENSDCPVFPEIFLPELAMSSFLVSVPVLKAHSLADITGTLKNMIGLAPPRFTESVEREVLHRDPAPALAGLRTAVITADDFASTKRAQKEGTRASHAGIDFYGGNRAIPGTCATLHTAVAIQYRRAAVVNCENGVRTNPHTHHTADTFVRGQLQRCNILQVLHDKPSMVSRPATHKIIPRMIATACAGTAVRISFRTPESDV